MHDGGADEDRTRDLLLAKQALSQLSYSPKTLYDYSNLGAENQSFFDKQAILCLLFLFICQSVSFTWTFTNSSTMFSLDGISKRR